MNFTTESGAIISVQGHLLGLVDGEPGSVDFSIEQLLKFHKLNPGFVHRLTHAHPIGMVKPSNRDIDFMIAMCFSLYPFPFRLGIINPAKFGDNYVFENIYIGMLEPKDVWKARGGTRKTEIYLEDTKYHNLSDNNWATEIAIKSYNYKEEGKERL